MIEGRTRKEQESDDYCASVKERATLAEIAPASADTGNKACLHPAAADLPQAGHLYPPSNTGYRKVDCVSESVGREGLSQILENRVARTLIGVDWLTVCGPLRWQKEAMESMIEIAKKVYALWGEPEPEAIQGRNGYAEGIKCGDMSFQWGHESESSAWCLNITGVGCASMGMILLKDLLRALYALSSSIHVTRIDIAIDLFNGVSELMENMEKACDNGHLQRVRTYEVMAPKKAKTSEKLSQTIYLGSRRGDRYVRVYDKGIEQKACAAGQWIRWELQERGTLANEVAADWVGYRVQDEVFYNDTPEAGFVGTLKTEAANMVCFQDCRGRVPSWWSELYKRFNVVEANKRTKKRNDPDADRWLNWVRTQVLPMLDSVTIGVGLDPRKDRGKVLNALIGKFDPNPSEHGSTVVNVLIDRAMTNLG